MLNPYSMPVWKQAPFIRLLLPFIAGIILQWYLQFSFSFILISTVSFLTVFLLFKLLPVAAKFKLRIVQGITVNLFLMSIGLLLTWQKDIRHYKEWVGNSYHNSDYVVVRIDEPLVEKSRSYKADGYIEAVIQNGKTIPCKGKLLLYFSKSAVAQKLCYGDKIVINKNLQLIKNSGNPGSFNYQRYAAFQQIFHNVFLKEKDWALVDNNRNINHFQKFIFTAREKILSVLRNNITADKDELGIAEALLIGYTNDLDKDIVQAYSNTGVVHVIAISGMHLGLIYVLLIWLFAKIPLIKKSKITQVLLILSCLWLFSLLTGGSASVIRSAVMFTFITIGNHFSKRSSIYNSLASSAFVMLCYNPYFLWDVGFQLSYLAVVGIIVFQKPIHSCIYIKNKWIDKVWKLMAISLAAQLLTFPICIYYFHQFPNLFLLTNIIIVPLSSLILYVEILLVAFSWMPYVGLYLGKIITSLVWLMNKTVFWINESFFAVWDNIHASAVSTWLLYSIVIGLSTFLINKNKAIFKISLVSLLAFMAIYAYDKWQFYKQQKIIVYNVNQHQAIDFVKGNSYQFVGDNILSLDGMLKNFHLKPSRITLQLDDRKNSLQNMYHKNIFYQLKDTKVAIIDSSYYFKPSKQRINLDVIIISKNPKLYISQLSKIFNCKKYIFDASNSLWKIDKWKRECLALNLKFHSIPEQGAFILDL